MSRKKPDLLGHMTESSLHALTLPRPETNYSRNSIAYRGVTALWNSLPANLKSADAIGIFKALLKKYDFESFKFDKLKSLNTFKNPLHEYFFRLVQFF